MLNLSEFKAVLAHEFGHFSQRSMKLSAYVYVANKVMGDIIYGRDFMDDILNFAKSVDIRITIVVWVFMGVLWLVRKGLELLFKAINIFSLSLGRQMEFNADRIGVSVAGSDAMVHALLRSGFADQAFRQMNADLWSAADHQLYSRDIFHHQLPAADLLRRRTKNPKLGERPSERGQAVEVFGAGQGELGIPLMWSTHPSNRDREKNAKDIYLSAEPDERSPWLLFKNPEAVRFEVSKRFYEVYLKVAPTVHYSDAVNVQQFLDEEYAETTYADEYHGFYDNRYIEITELEPMFSRWQQAPMSHDQAIRKYEALFGEPMQAWVKQHHQRLNDHDLLAGLKAKTLELKTSTLDFRGESHPPSAVPKLLEKVLAELKEDQAHKAEIDALVLRIHRQLAYQQNPLLGEDLVGRYRFHLGVQSLHGQVMQAAHETNNALAYAGARELSQEEFAYVRDSLGIAQKRLADALAEAERVRIPALSNMTPGERLRDFLLQKSEVRALSFSQDSIDPMWIQALTAQTAELQDKLRRLLFKNLGAILAMQERIRRTIHENPALLMGDTNIAPVT